MKKLFKNAIVAMAAIAIVGLAGCNKDDDGGGKTPPEVTEASLRIKLKNGAMQGTRAVGTVTNADHTEVTNFCVFVFNDDGYCWKGFFDVAGKTFTGDGSAIDTDGADPIGTLTVNTTATKVYVIANAGGDWTSAVEEEADLLPGTTFAYTFTDKWATGFDDTFTFVDDVAEVDVTCTFIPARITVKVDNQMEHYGEANTVTIDKVAVINARAQSFMFPWPGETSLVAPMPTYGNGIAVSGFVHHPASSLYVMEPVDLCDNYVYNASSTFDSYYYVLESAGTTTPANYPTIVTLVGRQADGTSPHMRYACAALA